MRSLIAVLIIGGLGVLYFWQKSGTSPQSATQPQVVQQSAPSTAAASAAPAREVSEHNWMKRSLDRARDVTEQTRTRTRESQNP